MATPADVWRIYVKPSMKGRMIFRKKTVNRKSARVLERNRIFADAKIAAEARSICMRRANEPRWRQICIYTDEKGVQRCRWICFVRLLRALAQSRLAKGGGPPRPRETIPPALGI